MPKAAGQKAPEASKGKVSKEPKETKGLKESKATKEIKEVKEPKATREIKEVKEHKAPKETKESKESKEIKDTSVISSKPITFICKFCSQEKTLDQMVILRQYYPPKAACKDCARSF